uniref:Uncharacterized protein n=1 Tax=Laurencieae sp. TaxID=2007162 RepID=A0A1Z1M321_9FLOR|nr:hypothetical protein [Laurencieae sp.]
MISTSDFFTVSFQGKWFTQTNTHLLKEKKQKVFLKELCILTNKAKDKSSITKKDENSVIINIDNRNFIKLLKVHKQTKLRVTINAIFQPINYNLFKINYSIIKNKYIYEEYIYFVNNNLMFSMGLVKSIYNNKYYGTVVTSYIRLMS